MMLWERILKIYFLHSKNGILSNPKISAFRKNLKIENNLNYSLNKGSEILLKKDMLK